MSKTINFSLLVLGFGGLALAMYLFLPTQVEKTSSVADVVESTQLAAATEPTLPSLYSDTSSSSPSVAAMPADEEVMPTEVDKQQQQYSSDDVEPPPPPSGGYW